MPLQEIVRTHTIDGVWSVKPFNRGAVGNLQFGRVKESDLGVFPAYGLVGRHPIEVPRSTMKGRGAMSAAISA